MRRGDLDRTGAKIGLNQIMSNYGNLSFGQRQNQFLANKILIPFIPGVNRHRGIAEHRFRPGGSNGQKFLPPGKRILNIVKESFRFSVFGLFIGKRSFASRTPVDNVIALIDKILLVEVNEGLCYCQR